MLEFGRALPELRARSERLLRRHGLAEPRVLGFAVLLLDRGLFRIGSEVYAEDNGSYGLTTLERRHVTAQPRGTLVFDYIGKTGRHVTQTIADRRLYSIGAELRGARRRSPNFLAYRNGDGRLLDVHAADINAFIKRETGGDFTAKDFRTWHATVLAAAAVARTPTPGRSRAVNEATRAVADALGNTPAVSRSSYIDPRVFDLYRAGETIPGPVADAFIENGERERCERAVLRLLR